MTLPSSGSISLANVNIELGRSSTTNISLGESSVRTLASVASGTISLSNLRGKSYAPTFTPAGSTNSGSPAYYDDYGSGGTVSYTITCSQSVVWNWSRTGTSGGASQSIASGGTASSITFSLTNTTSSYKFNDWLVNATVNGVTYYWAIYLENSGFA